MNAAREMRISGRMCLLGPTIGKGFQMEKIDAEHLQVRVLQKKTIMDLTESQ